MGADVEDARGLAREVVGPARVIAFGTSIVAPAGSVVTALVLVVAFAEFRDESRLGRHLLIPAAAILVFLFPLWGIIFPGSYTLTNVLPFVALGWLCVGAIAAGILRTRRPVTFASLGRPMPPGGRR
jgi:hypothetical protein